MAIIGASPPYSYWTDIYVEEAFTEEWLHEQYAANHLKVHGTQGQYFAVTEIAERKFRLSEYKAWARNIAGEETKDWPPMGQDPMARSDGVLLSDGAADIMGFLAEEYVKAGCPPFKLWTFTPPDQDDPTYGELRALGLVHFMGPRGGPWRLTQKGVDWIMRNRPR